MIAFYPQITRPSPLVVLAVLHGPFYPQERRIANDPMRRGLRKNAMKTIIALLGVLVLESAVHAAEPLTERQARITAAWWVQGTVFDDVRGAEAVWASYRGSVNLTSAKMSTPRTKELLTHIDESLLAVRGDTGYCGEIKEPTWVIIGDKEFAELNGGYPVMINARTGKVVDCRS